VPKFRVERAIAPLWVRPLIPIIAALVTFILTATLVVMAEANPLEAYYYFLIDPLTGRVSALEVLVKSTPLLLTGAAVTFAFSAGYWNIGVEGQLYAGPSPLPGWALFWVACHLYSLSPSCCSVVSLPVCSGRWFPR